MHSRFLWLTGHILGPLTGLLFTSFVSVLAVLGPFSSDPIKHQGVNVFRQVGNTYTNTAQTIKLLPRELTPSPQTAPLTASGHNF